MAANYAIEAIFRIIDGATAPMKAIETQSGLLKNGIQKADKQLSAMGQTAKNAIKGAAVGAIAALSAGIAVATKQYIEFDNAVTASGALFKDLDPTAQGYADSLAEIGAKAREVAAITEFNAVDTAGALSKMAMAGMDSKTAMDLLAGTTNLATAAGTDLTTAVDIATDALGAFGMDATAENLQRISDVMAKTASTSNTGLLDMFEALKYAAPSFTAAGQSAETLSAAIGTLANAGIKGSQAGTAMRAVFTQLGNSAKQAKLKELGVQVQDAEGNFLNFVDILGQLEGATASMGTAQLTEVMNDIFGKTAGSGMLVLLQSGTEALKAYEQEMINAGGSAAVMADAMRMSLGNQIEVLKSGLTELGFRFVEAFKTQGSSALQGIITYIQAFDPTTIINVLVTITDIVANLFGFVWKFKDVLIAVFAAVKTYQGIMLLFAAAIKMVTIAQTALNLVMSLSPFEWVVIIISALVGVIVYLALNWDKVTAAVQVCLQWLQTMGSYIADFLIGVWNGFIDVLSSCWDWIVSIGQAVGDWFVGAWENAVRVFDSFIDKLVTVKEFFTGGAFVNAIKSLGGTILSYILSPVESILNTLSYIPGIGKWAASGADAITEMRAGLTTNAESPVTQGERLAYSREESISTTNLNIGLEKGLTGSMSGYAPGIDINMLSSGAF